MGSSILPPRRSWDIAKLKVSYPSNWKRDASEKIN